jgi:Ca-activated chloride channel family protein
MIPSTGAQQRRSAAAQERRNPRHDEPALLSFCASALRLRAFQPPAKAGGLRGAGVFAALIALAVSPARTQDQPTPVFRTRADIVRVDVLATQGGRPIDELKSEDFELFDNGVAQQPQLASIDDLEIDVVLAVDVSASVRGGLLGTLRDAAGALVSALRPGDRAAVVTFANAVTIRTALSADHTSIVRALEQVDAGGSTSLIDAAYTGLAVTNGNERPTLVLIFSDGFDTSSWLAPRPVVTLARRSSVVIDAIVVANRRLRTERRRTDAEAAKETMAADEDVGRFLVDLTDATGGRLIEGAGGSRLSASFIDALKTFRTRYQLTYTPSGVDQPGYHTIEVRVKKPGATVRARPGYTR